MWHEAPSQADWFHNISKNLYMKGVDASRRPWWGDLY